MNLRLHVVHFVTDVNNRHNWWIRYSCDVSSVICRFLASGTGGRFSDYVHTLIIRKTIVDKNSTNDRRLISIIYHSRAANVLRGARMCADTSRVFFSFFSRPHRSQRSVDTLISWHRTLLLRLQKKEGKNIHVTLYVSAAFGDRLTKMHVHESGHVREVYRAVAGYINYR